MFSTLLDTQRRSMYVGTYILSTFIYIYIYSIYAARRARSEKQSSNKTDASMVSTDMYIYMIATYLAIHR